MGLALFFLAVRHEVEGGRRRSVPSKEDLELEREVRRLNKPAVKSIKAWDLLSLHHNLSVSISKLIKGFFFFFECPTGHVLGIASVYFYRWSRRTNKGLWF